MGHLILESADGLLDNYCFSRRSTTSRHLKWGNVAETWILFINFPPWFKFHFINWVYLKTEHTTFGLTCQLDKTDSPVENRAIDNPNPAQRELHIWTHVVTRAHATSVNT